MNVGHRSWCIVVGLMGVTALALAGCGDDDGGDPDGGGVRDDGGSLDGSRRDDGGVDAGSDGGADVDGGAHVDGGTTDGGATMCHTPSECSLGYTCLDGRCVVDSGCCAYIDCWPGARCDPTSCECFGGSGCCETGECEDPTKYCDFESCGCLDPPTCDPGCDADSICEWGRCVPRCFIEGCPDPSDLCSETGCAPAACTAEECFSMSPPLRCDPYVGCSDPCTTDDWSWCESSGGACYLGECVDASCGAGLGMPIMCAFVADCCGDWYCQSRDDGEPWCPTVCPTGGASMPEPDPGLCVCGFAGGPIFGGEDGDGGGSGSGGGGGGLPPGGGDPPPPHPGGFVYCTDLRPFGGGIFPGVPPIPEDPTPTPYRP